MKQKKLGDILYVFTDEPYEITEDTDASIVYVQAHSKEGFEALNPDLTFKKINYNVFTVKEPEWKEYLVTPDDNNSQAEPSEDPINPNPDPTPVEYDKYTITFMDGADSIYSITDVTGTAIDIPLNPTKEGYTFNGWSTDGTTVITPESYIGTENITYFAVWTEVQNQDPAPSEFVPTTYSFVSFDPTGETEYATGKAQTTADTGNGRTKIQVTENSVEGFVGNYYWISSSAQAADNTLYPLYSTSDDNIGVGISVRIYAEGQIPVIPDPNQPVLTECNFISYNTTLNEERQNGKFTYYTNTSLNGLVQITITEASENNSEDMIWLSEQQSYYISDTFTTVGADDNEIYPIYMTNDGTSSPTEIGIKVISIA